MKGKTYRLAHRVYHTAVALEGNSGVILTRKDGAPHRFVADIAEAEKLAGRLIDYHADRARLSDDEWNQMVEFPATQMAKIRERSRSFYTPEQDAADRGEAPAPATDPKAAAAEDEERKRNEERERVRKELAERKAAAERKASEEEAARKRVADDEAYARELEELEQLRREQEGDGAGASGG